MKFSGLIFLLFTCYSASLYAQQEDVFFIKSIYDYTLTEGKCYKNLEELCKVGGRLAGSPAYDEAVKVTAQQLEKINQVEVSLQPCEVNGWERGDVEIVQILDNGKKLRASSLGNAIGTGEGGLTAEVIEVQSLDEVEKLGRSEIAGKIVFFNRPMDPTKIRTFEAYGGAADQRVAGPSKAAAYGAVATLVRSLTLKQDSIPHTGTLRYNEAFPKIPALAISTLDANYLSELLKEKSVQIYIENYATPTSIKETHTVIGEIKGSQYPDEIILVGGHLDAWDIGQGAHDDGAGCVQSIQVLETLEALNYKPKRTIRCVLFANEENGLAGGLEYARVSNEKGEYHLAALESDAGGFTPRGFSFDGHEEILERKYRKITEWLPLLEPYGLTFRLGGSGADINPLKSQKGILIGLRPDSQRYFDFHHTAVDTLEAVNERELKMGAASMTALIYLLDKYGLE